MPDQSTANARSRTCTKCGTVFLLDAGVHTRERCYACSPRREYNRAGVCVVCGKSFRLHRSRIEMSKYCSVSCKHEAGRIRRTCLHCGTSFIVRRSVAEGCEDAANARLYCSHGCKRAARPKSTKACEVCGKPFTAYASLNRTRCSRKCAGPKPNRAVHTCQVCGRGYHVMPSRSALTKYCSRECAGVGRAGQVRTDQPPVRYRLMSLHWRTLRKQIIERDGGLCTRCGSHVRLSVHHIIPWRVSHDDSPGNLVTLCNSCHHIVERETERLMFAR